MPERSVIVLAALWSQAFANAIIGTLLFGLFRQYRKAYLLHWSASWLALALFHAATAGGLAFGSNLSVAWQGVLGAVTSAAGYLQIAWLLFGVSELVRRRPVRLSRMRWTLVVAGGLGALAGLFFPSLASDAAGRSMLHVGMRSLFAGLAFGMAALALWRARANKPGIGFTWAAIALGLYAVKESHYAGIAVAWAGRGVLVGYAPYLGFVDVVLQAMLGVAMITCLLDDEREAAELVTVEIEHLAYHDALTGLPNGLLLWTG